MMRAAILEVVAIDAGDYHVAQLHLARHAGDVGRLIGIELHVVLSGIEFLDAAKSAAARAALAENHEGGRATVEALVDVRAARLFADGVQLAFAQAAFQVIQRFEVGLAAPRPFGQAGAFWRPWDAAANPSPPIHPPFPPPAGNRT